MPRTHRYQMMLDPEEYKKWMDAAKRDFVTLNEFIRRAMHAYLSAQQTRKEEEK